MSCIYEKKFSGKFWKYGNYYCIFVLKQVMKRGTLTKNGKPTRLAVELYLKYFELGGNPSDEKINPLISERIQQIMGWKDGEGIVCLLWGLHPSTKSSKKHSYHEPMIKAKELAWEIHNTCGL